MTETLILTRSEIEGVVDTRSVFESLRGAFIANATSTETHGQRFPLRLPAGAPQGASAMILAPGLCSGIPAYSAKSHAKYPGASPALKGVIILHALDDGRVIAILESTWLTNLRTGLVGAIGADALAQRDSSHVAIIGAGAQGRVQLECLKRVRPISSVSVFDVSQDRANAFATTEESRLGLDIRVADSVGEAVERADIVVAATWATEPFLAADMIRPGTHITTLGVDQPGRAELASDLIEVSYFVADDVDLACRMGAIASAGLTESSIDATLAEVLSGCRDGRADDSQITIFGSVGLPFQDLVVAWDAYQSASRAGVGHIVQLLG